ncbi:MAG: gas vesicle protein GvpJ [Gaiellaceae bacterium]
MAVATNGGANYLRRAPSPSGLADVLNVILDKGIVIDAFVRVSVIGIELVTIDARIVIASVDTYLRFAEAVNRLDLAETEVAGLPELQEVGAKVVTEHKIDEAEEEVEEKAEAGLRGAAKGVAAGAAVAGAAAVAKHLVDRRKDDGDEDEE